MSQTDGVNAQPGGGVRRLTSKVWLVAIVALAVLTTAPTLTHADQPAPRPNVVVVMLDDMPAHTMWVLQNTLELMADGTNFTNAVVQHALCCPSRATFLTGQFSHNNGVRVNKGGWPKFKQHGWSDSHLGHWMHAAGYQTALVGKYLNGYGDSAFNTPEPLYGWDRLGVLSGSSAYNYVDYNINVDGVMEKQRAVNGGVYQTDRLSELAVDYIGDMASTGDPFFLWVTPLAPHTQVGKRYAIPAPEYAGTHDGAQWRPPSYDDPGRYLRPKTEWRTKIGKAEAAIIDHAYESILESLESVDDMMVDVFAALDAAGVRDDTVIVFTADQGFYPGELGLAQGKIVPYETALNVPLYITGPGFDAAAVDDRLTVNADVPATILELARTSSPRPLDGVPLGDLFDDRVVPLEGFRNGREYRGVRTDDQAWWNYQAGRLEAEWYDLAADPWQNRNLTNAAGRWRVPDAMQTLNKELAVCAGAECVRSWMG